MLKVVQRSGCLQLACTTWLPHTLILRNAQKPSVTRVRNPKTHSVWLTLFDYITVSTISRATFFCKVQVLQPADVNTVMLEPIAGI